MLKRRSLMDELKSFIVHNGSVMNSLNPSGPMTDWTGGSSFPMSSFESLFEPSPSKSSSSVEGELVDGTLSSKKVSRLS